jgi:hypothetical protein
MKFKSFVFFDYAGAINEDKIDIKINDWIAKAGATVRDRKQSLVSHSRDRVMLVITILYE